MNPALAHLSDVDLAAAIAAEKPKDCSCESESDSVGTWGHTCARCERLTELLQERYDRRAHARDGLRYYDEQQRIFEECHAQYALDDAISDNLRARGAS